MKQEFKLVAECCLISNSPSIMESALAELNGEYYRVIQFIRTPDAASKYCQIHVLCEKVK